MIARVHLEAACFLLLAGLLGYCWLFLVPDAPALSAYALNPAYCALVGATLASTVYLALRLLPSRREFLERLLLAVFLAAMPGVYLWAALTTSGSNGGVIETVGLILFGATAYWGYRNSTLLLGLGIVAHGIAWDAWHHDHTQYIESWYPFGCLLVDMGLGLLVIVQHWPAGGPQPVPGDIPPSRDRR